jgi:hypothetical protein
MAERTPMRNRRDSNRKRLITRLEERGQPLPVENIVQGSYAMYTMVQDDSSDWDIDDGVVFDRNELKGPKGGDFTPQDAKKMVAEALVDKRLNNDPDVRKNCVRINYVEGYHLDIPVYRRFKDENDTDIYELAGTDWRESNPRIISKWFNDAVIERSPSNGNGDRQMRRIVGLLKAFGRGPKRKTWDMPSGLILTSLVGEMGKYHPAKDRDDLSFYETIKAIRYRLRDNKIVQHPVVGVNETLTKTDADACIKFLEEKLQWALDKLAPTLSTACERSEALKCWKMVFDTDFFDNEIEKSETEEKDRGRISVIASSNIPIPKPFAHQEFYYDLVQRTS